MSPICAEELSESFEVCSKTLNILDFQLIDLSKFQLSLKYFTAIAFGRANSAYIFCWHSSLSHRTSINSLSARKYISVTGRSRRNHKHLVLDIFINISVVTHPAKSSLAVLGAASGYLLICSYSVLFEGWYWCSIVVWAGSRLSRHSEKIAPDCLGNFSFNSLYWIRAISDWYASTIYISVFRNTWTIWMSGMSIPASLFSLPQLKSDFSLQHLTIEISFDYWVMNKVDFSSLTLLEEIWSLCLSIIVHLSLWNYVFACRPQEDDRKVCAGHSFEWLGSKIPSSPDMYYRIQYSTVAVGSETSNLQDSLKSSRVQAGYILFLARIT